MERFPRDWKRRRHDGRSLRRARRLVQQTMTSWWDLLSAFSYLEVGVEEVLDAVEELMGAFGLSSNDAVHTATAEYTGARTMATTDAGFALVPEPRLAIRTAVECESAEGCAAGFNGPDSRLPGAYFSSVSCFSR